MAQPAVMAAPWRDSAGDLLDVRYSGLGNITHRAGKSALVIKPYMSDPHWRPAIRASRALVRFRVRWGLRHGASQCLGQRFYLCRVPDLNSPVSKGVVISIALNRMNMVAAFAREKVDF